MFDDASAGRLTLSAALKRLNADRSHHRQRTCRLTGRPLRLPADAGNTEHFHYDAQPGVDQHLLNDIASCRYLENATNVLMIGPPGVGDKNAAVGLVRSAAEA